MTSISSLQSEYIDWMPSYADLPMEIILHIFRFLGHADLQAAGATCRRWRDALFDGEFCRNTVVRFTKVCLSDKLPPASHFIKCERPFRKFYLEDVTFGQVNELMAHIGCTAVDITFDKVDLADKQFYGIVRHLPKLRSLTVNCCSSLFMSGSFLDNTDDRMIVDGAFSSIKHLSLRRNQYLSDAILLRLTALIQQIETLDMSYCHITYYNAIQRRFYPNENNVSPSESILTFKFIRRVIATHMQSLRELNFGHTLMGGPALTSLCELEQGPPQLLRLRLASCRQLSTPSIVNFLQTQPKLVLLDLSDSNCVSDDCIEALLNFNPWMQELNFSGCCVITNEGAMQLSGLKHLRHLNISRCEGITSEGIIQGIARTRNEVLRVLRMSNMNVCDDCIVAVAQNLPNLTHLNLSNCINGVNDRSVQSIIQNLHSLCELSLENCFGITDAALTGINISKLNLQASSSSSFDSFHPLAASSVSPNSSTQSFKISLRSKAEEEIVRDANRKRAMLAAYELNLTDDCDIDGYSVQQLRCLRALNLRGCNITDVSLKYGLNNVELSSLSLSHCQQISIVGVESLVKNCPSIEQLDLSDCYNINDKTIQVITNKLHRLRALHISGCTQLSDHSLDSILVNCKCLQTLSVYRCRRMYTDIEERLMNLSTLQNLYMDNVGNIDNVEIFRLKKRFDY